MTYPPPQQPTDHRRGLGRADITCLAALLILTGIVYWNRVTFDHWTTRHDLMTFFVPWYAFLGERLRDFEVPGWNPYLFSGTPFAGDPESGWMYVPAMVFSPILSIINTFKALVGFHLLIAGLGTYAFTRVLGMGAAASLVASVAFVFGPVLQWTTYCCTIFSQFSTWIPLALLGVELSLRAQQRRTQMLSWFVTGFALSQMFAGWIGEGWILALLVVGGYIGYRAVLSPLNPDQDLRQRLTLAVVTGFATFASGLALGAAGILIRLDVNAQTKLAGGNYDALGQGTRLNPPWTLDEMFVRIMGSGYPIRSTTLGGAVIVLALLAPYLVRRKFAVPFFSVLTVIPLILALDTTPLHYVFYVIPGFRAFHEHDPWRVYSVATIGPAVLSGAVVDSLPSLSGRRLRIIILPLLAMAFAAYVLFLVEDFIGWQPLIAATIATGVLIIAVAWPRTTQRGFLAPLLAGVIVFAIFLQPTAIELTGSWFGWPEDESWAQQWDPDPAHAAGLAADISSTDPGGAGEFLQIQMENEGPFRYLGYDGYRYPGGGRVNLAATYRRFAPDVQSILVNGRPIFLHLQDIQGYNPLQLERYVDYLTALNGMPQNYHYAYLFPSGVDSPLLNLLNVRYVILPTGLPPEREDVAALTKDKRQVFHNNRVDIYENPDAFPRAWIVHDVRQLPRDEILPELQAGAIDPRQTAFVEETPPEVEAAQNPAADLVRFLQFEPDVISVATRSDAPGLLVLSEIYDPGWRAYVDGRQVDVLATNYALRGVPIPAGEHTVELRYEPTSLRVGLAITGVASLAMLATIMACVWPAVRRVVVGRGEQVTAPGQPSELSEV